MQTLKRGNPLARIKCAIERQQDGYLKVIVGRGLRQCRGGHEHVDLLEIKLTQGYRMLISNSDRQVFVSVGDGTVSSVPEKRWPLKEWEAAVQWVCGYADGWRDNRWGI